MRVGTCSCGVAYHGGVKKVSKKGFPPHGAKFAHYDGKHRGAKGQLRDRPVAYAGRNCGALVNQVHLRHLRSVLRADEHTAGETNGDEIQPSAFVRARPRPIFGLDQRAPNMRCSTAAIGVSVTP